MKADEITLRQIMDAREEKSRLQAKMQSAFSHKVMLSIGMNIPGSVKDSSLIRKAFGEGCRTIENSLEENGVKILDKVLRLKRTGPYGIYIVDTDAHKRLKKRMVEIEECHPIGRLYDIDVYDTKGKVCSRIQMGYLKRRCLLCDGEAKQCGRARIHAVDALYNRAESIMSDNLR